MDAGVILLLWVLVGVILLVAMIVKFKINSIVALILSAIFIALVDGIPVGDLVTTMEDGLGGTLKSLALIVIFGAAIGKLMTDSGASQQFADTIVDKLGIKSLPVALLIIGVIFGMSMFYVVAFLIVAPLVISIAKEADIPYMCLIIPAVSGTMMSHSLFPPQPGPMALASAFGADIDAGPEGFCPRAFLLPIGRTNYSLGAVEDRSPVGLLRSIEGSGTVSSIIEPTSIFKTAAFSWYGA